MLNSYTQEDSRPIVRTSVYLQRDAGPFIIFHCYLCTKPLFKFKGRVIDIVPSGEIESEAKVMQFPYVVLCRGKHIKYGKCPAEYVIQGFTL